MLFDLYEFIAILQKHFCKSCRTFEPFEHMLKIRLGYVQNRNICKKR